MKWSDIFMHGRLDYHFLKNLNFIKDQLFQCSEPLPNLRATPVLAIKGFVHPKFFSYVFDAFELCISKINGK